MFDIQCPYCDSVLTIQLDENVPAPTSTEKYLKHTDVVTLICKKAWESTCD